MKFQDIMEQDLIYVVSKFRIDTNITFDKHNMNVVRIFRYIQKNSTHHDITPYTSSAQKFCTIALSSQHFTYTLV